ncbi:MAG: hypothetical protein JXR37_27890 [Kiritimatiellae bacterium]|nr:hypothetical protein [Kiritimatiellia bacterium]
MKHPHTFVGAFSNGYLHYGPPADHYDRGGYEVTECLLAPDWQRIFERTAVAVLGRLHAARDASVRARGAGEPETESGS